MFKCNWFKTISCIRISNSEQFCDGSQQVFGTEVLTVMMVTNYDDGDDGGGWHRGDNNKGFFEGDHA